MCQYKNIETQIYNYYKKFIDKRYIFSIIIEYDKITISIKHNPNLIDSNYFYYKDSNDNIKEAIGYLYAYWNNVEKTSILVSIVAGFWNKIESIKDPLKGLGIGTFLMIIYIDIIQRLGINTSELDDHTDIEYDNNQNRKKSFYTKFNYVRLSDYGPEMILENIQNNLINIENIMNNIISKQNNNQLWEWINK